MKSTYIEFPEQGTVSVRTEDVSSDDLAPDQALIRNETSIISAGTELAILHGYEIGMTYPTRPGYGSIGRIVEKGPALSRFAVGDRVFYAGKHASVQRFHDQNDHQWQHLFPVPESLDPIDAAVGCMAQIAMTAPNVTELALGDTVAVFGLGLVGILAAQLYQLRGARVIGVDPVRQRCDLARKVGIEEIVDAPPTEQVEAVKEATGGEGAVVTVDATGVTEVVLNCVRATAKFGQVVLVGSPRVPVTGNVTEIPNLAHMHGLVIRGAHMWRYPLLSGRNVPRSVEWTFATVFDQIASGRLKVRDLISHVITPADAPAAYDGLRNKTAEYTGVVIDWRTCD